MKVLIKAGGNVNQADTSMGASPLYAASQKGNKALVKVLIEAGCNVNQAETKDGCSPLYAASYYGNVATVKLLIKAGGNVNQATTTDGATPLCAALDNNSWEIAKVLLEAGGNIAVAFKILFLKQGTLRIVAFICVVLFILYWIQYVSTRNNVWTIMVTLLIGGIIWMLGPIIDFIISIATGQSNTEPLLEL